MTDRYAVVTIVALPAVPDANDLTLLSLPERERAARFARLVDGAAFITARATLRRLLADATGLHAAELPLERDARGRPYLAADGHDAMDFNLSHSGALAVIGIAFGGRIGVDVEQHGAARALRDLVPQVMGPRESEVLSRLDGEQFAREFYECWTRKEAVIKALGIGLEFPLQSIDVPAVEHERVVKVRTGSADEWTVSTREPVPGYSLSVALDDDEHRVSVRHLDGVSAAPPHRTVDP